MDKVETDAKYVLNQLRELSAMLSETGPSENIEHCFEKPLEIIQKAMSFDVSVLYKITNAVDDVLMLKTVQVSDPNRFRPDLFEGQRLELSLSSPNPRFINEVKAFRNRTVSSINVPGRGCDIMGFIYLPETFGGSYLFGGDFTGNEAGVKDYEASVCEIMCNYLSTILVKGQLEELAINDNLTGLYNARKIREEVDRVCGRFSRKTQTHAVVALCDIDHFKAVNDTYGHLQGDQVLREVGLLLKSSFRSHFDIAGRYGGEEFLVIFDETDIDTAYVIVERFREKIAGKRFTRIDESGKPDPNDHLNITISFGLAEHCPKEDKDPDLWISEADKALYRAKKEGRNRTVIFRA